MSRRTVEIARTITASGAALRAPVTGGSMLPWIWAGDRFVVQPVTAADMAPGDLLLYERGEQLVAHRMIRRCRIGGDDGLLTRGDWFAEADPPIPVSSVIGKVIAIERGERTLRLDRGVGSMCLRLTGWLALRHPRFLPGMRQLWKRLKK